MKLSALPLLLVAFAAYADRDVITNKNDLPVGTFVLNLSNTATNGDVQVRLQRLSLSRHTNAPVHVDWQQWKVEAFDLVNIETLVGTQKTVSVLWVGPKTNWIVTNITANARTRSPGWVQSPTPLR